MDTMASHPHTPSTIDARAVHACDSLDTELTPQDYAALALLAVNNKEPINSLTKANALTYIAQVGGLHDADHEIDYSPTVDYFTFNNRTPCPHSTELNDTLQKLADLNLITESQHTNRNSKLSRYEYTITDSGGDLLDHALHTVIDVSTIRTLKLVKSLYNSMASPKLCDITVRDYDFRESGDGFVSGL